ncbi:DUF5302 domain-containing protein [Streptomyces sp. NPDC002328]|uniref:DUF5302 domain-containing protein n=1 Tax=Streptomyces sp. NPDC002328 TaxID=3364642 RepID=UPI00367445BE
MADESSRGKSEDSTRDRFLAALQRKNDLSRAKEAHEEGRLKVKAMSGPAGKKRYFHRKTG